MLTTGFADTILTNGLKNTVPNPIHSLVSTRRSAVASHLLGPAVSPIAADPVNLRRCPSVRRTSATSMRMTTTLNLPFTARLDAPMFVENPSASIRLIVPLPRCTLVPTTNSVSPLQVPSSSRSRVTVNQFQVPGSGQGTSPKSRIQNPNHGSALMSMEDAIRMFQAPEGNASMLTVPVFQPLMLVIQTLLRLTATTHPCLKIGLSTT